MTLEKAMEILQLNLNEAGKKMPPDVADALRLHIEAAKALQYGRRIGQHVYPTLLPGETEE